MPKIVIVGSCRYEPYIILTTPEKVPNLWNTEEGYKIASKKFYPAIKEADEIWIYAPEGIGKHTLKDIQYAKKHSKKIRLLIDFNDGNETPKKH